jgi:hypothetical protein
LRFEKDRTVSLSRWAFGAGVADRVQNFGDCDGRRLRRDPGRPFFPREVKSVIAGERIRPILHPAILFALLDCAGLEIAQPVSVRVGGRRSLVIAICKCSCVNEAF